MKNRNVTPTVSELTWQIKDLLEGEFSGISVTGEVSQPTTSASGHMYFTLKDESAAISCVIWRSTVQRLKAVPAHGQQINVSGDVQLYPPSGRYQIVVKSVEQAGEGALQLAFERLKKKLELEGLFEESLKKALPKFPQKIGVVTSETGAAFQDIRSTLERRYPLTVVQLYHAAVQGLSAAAEISAGIEWFGRAADVDVLIVGRGGGSLEDLWPFNEEVVARAIVACPIPVISAVGHETDFSISDFVADTRAATPTQAAVMATPDVRDLKLAVSEMERRVETFVRGGLEVSREHIQKLLKTHALLVVKDKIRFSRDVIRRNRMQMDQRMKYQLGNLRQSVLSISKSTGPSLQIRIMNERKKLELTQRQIKELVKTRVDFGTDSWREVDFRLRKLDPTEPLSRGFTRILQQGKWVRRLVDFDAKSEHEIEWKDGKINQ
jgi:exodeoxyribonuclease VII large subunit